MDNIANDFSGVLYALYIIIGLTFLPLLYFLFKRFIKSTDDLKEAVQKHQQQIQLFTQHCKFSTAATAKSLEKHDEQIGEILTIINAHTKQIGQITTMCELNTRQIENMMDAPSRNSKPNNLKIKPAKP